ncbi:tryptophan halogenase family protein [Actinoallomurus rhizosphaericola]|uniref:tryptophan halogenase family protein n=1 Tax=Actinoallomurus rhizosphaericola TaxID=2952536 RepID=UPI00209146B4|nr:tryptophan halogenase family protein [Actinoallomurus rhizosphaericola]MCO5993387.1 tryptophan 7-halogenase [Actinoallomurus rhizosphaericola]
MTGDDQIKNIVVLGGGTAGWMSAAYLGRALGRSVRITVLEAPAIPRIGVGEATIPNLQKVFFDFLGLSEEDWMPECNASYKMGIRFINWRTPGEGEARSRPHGKGRDEFDHSFGLLPEHDNLPLSHYWTYKKLHGGTDEPFDRACYVQPAIFDRKLSPRHRDGTKWASYAWHFDAQLVADFLRRFATKEQGAVHIEDRFTDAEIDQNGHITAINTEAGRRLEGDLFIDCSGFRSLLINQVMKEPFLDMSDHLLNDRAVATQVPNDDENDGIEPYTSAIAMSSGWTWKIPLLGRFGTGYVYSSRFATQDEATEEFCRMWNLDPEKHSLNHIRFRVGRNRRAWVKNCVGIGLSSCFLEPLESTGIYFVYAALYQLVRNFPDKRFDPVVTNRFNREIEKMFDDTRDFIQAHFSFAPRNDTPFWRACKELELADDFKEKVARYKAGLGVDLPVTDESSYYGNFEAEFRNFWSNANYYCVFTGLDVLPEHSTPLLSHRPDSVRSAEAVFAEVARRRDELLGTLPSTYAYLRHLHGN